MGKDQPVLHELNQVLHPACIDWDIYVMPGEEEAVKAKLVQLGAAPAVYEVSDAAVEEAAAAAETAPLAGGPPAA